MPQPLEYEQAGYNGPDGVQVGRTSTDLVGFYGATPVVRPITISTNAASTSTASTGGVGWVTAAEFNNFTIAVSTMQSALKQLGILP